MKLYKVLNEDGSCYHGDRGSWPLPTQNEDGTWTPGDWMPALEGELVPCDWGYHVLEAEMLLAWAGPAVFEVEVAPCDGIRHGDKWVVRGPCRLLRRMPIGEREWRLFACDCAERVVYLCDDDPRPRQTINVIRRYAEGKATTGELFAAGIAAGKATTETATEGIARDAARVAMWVTTGFVAWIAAKSTAEHAAWIAAKAAADDAAEIAAEVAANVAAGTAVEIAAIAIERRWQAARLIEYLEGRA